MSVRVAYEPPRMKVAGTVVVCCIHGAEKHRVIELVADTSREQVGNCPCCLNLYSTDIGDPIVLCHECRPRRAAA